ncbi:MAG: macrolide ABC transporter ATP-binding protein, partial [Cyanobacteria bacterium]|nr:macrolide ABC transporter ATP-binding protein [Cyanobacteria bacterium CG_2015-04_32_10]
QIFRNLNDEKMTIILVTHEHDVGEEAKRIIHFADGKIIDN